MAGYLGFNNQPDDATYDPYKATRQQTATGTPYQAPTNGTGYGAYQAPTSSFGNVKFDQTPGPNNDWAKYLASLTNPDQINALGLGTTEDPNTMSTAYDSWINMNANSMSPAAQAALRTYANRNIIPTAYQQARATQPGMKYAQFLAGINPTDTLNSWSPQTANRQVMFHRVRGSF